jgi:hypothetical protein
MSAFGGKADMKWCCDESPLMTQSGHSANPRSILRHDQPCGLTWAMREALDHHRCEVCEVAVQNDLDTRVREGDPRFAASGVSPNQGGDARPRVTFPPSS